MNIPWTSNFQFIIITSHLYIGSFALSLYQRMSAGLSPVWAYEGVQLQGMATPSPITPTTSCLTTEKTFNRSTLTFWKGYYLFQWISHHWHMGHLWSLLVVQACCNMEASNLKDILQWGTFWFSLFVCSFHHSL